MLGSRIFARVLAALLPALGLGAAASPAQTPPKVSNPTAAASAAETPALSADWPMDRVTLTDGTTYQGLIVSETPSTIEFMEVRRPRGKPMFLVVRPLSRDAIQQEERITAEDREQLRERLESYKRRALVEGRRMEDLVLTSSQEGDQKLWNYSGEWFTLASTADETMTRRLIVRLGQIFTTYRQLLPPRSAGDVRVHIRLFGNYGQYEQTLQKFGLSIRNPAVYLVDRNLILAGSDVDRFDAELARVNRQHEEIRKQFDALVADVPARVKKLGEDLKAAGIPPDESLRILLAEQRKWSELRKDLQRKLAAVDRANAAKFNEVTRRMFTRLSHEAFHAYLETYVFPRQSYDVPRWLNEGLAQIFEAGMLEADSLRIDAPNLGALEKLQADLRSGQPLELAELLTAGSSTFLGPHDQNAKNVSRAYYYSWGLAYYLAFDRGVFDDPALEVYLSPESARLSPVERFEKLVGMPLAQFQGRWRAAMLALPGGP